jgi:hypothetical protein
VKWGSTTRVNLPSAYNCQMIKKWFILPAFLLLYLSATSQKGEAVDSSFAQAAALSVDTTDEALLDFDELFRDFDAFMDSILTPRSYLLASVSLGKSYFNYTGKSSYSVETKKQLTWSPLIGYYHKNGLGIGATGYLINDNNKLNLYQAGISPSFDYLKNKDLATGISYTKFFTKDSLSFYTSPLQNEVYGYFTYRKWWIRPTVAVSYGWGSRSDYAEREEVIQDIRIIRRGYTYINTKESISDFSLITSVRHDFYWLSVLAKKDHIRFTPQLTLTSGTQKFGFNQSSNTYITLLRNNSNVLYSTESLVLDDQLNFQPLSLSLFFRGEYSLGKFFIQPQFAIDYYFPADSKNLSTIFSVNAGFIF